MKKLAAAAIVAASTAGAASAADLPSRKAPVIAPPPPVMTWTGFYIGLNAGGVWDGNKNITTVGAPVFSGPTWETELATSTALTTGSGSGSSSGAILGGQIGYNWQTGSFLLGLEADIGGLVASRDRLRLVGAGVPAAFPGETIFSATTSQKSVDYLGTVRGRLGFIATPTFLLYATGGLAYGGVKASTAVWQFDANNGVPGNAPYGTFGAISKMKTGWTAGGGVEWMFQPNWSLKVEYLYYDLGRATFGSPLSLAVPAAFNSGYTAAVATSVRYTGHVARAGVNYHFNWGVPAPVVASY